MNLFVPQNLNPETVIALSGFTPITSGQGVGWELKYKNHRRLHAQTWLNGLSLHRDKTIKDKHQATSNHPRVRKMMKTWEALDYFAYHEPLKIVKRNWWNIL